MRINFLLKLLPVVALFMTSRAFAYTCGPIEYVGNKFPIQGNIFPVGSVSAVFTCTGQQGGLEYSWRYTTMENPGQVIEEGGGSSKTFSRSTPGFLTIESISTRETGTSCGEVGCPWIQWGGGVIGFDEIPSVSLSMPGGCLVRQPYRFSINATPPGGPIYKPSVFFSSPEFGNIGQVFGEAEVLPLTRTFTINAASFSAYGQTGGTDSSTVTCRNVPTFGTPPPTEVGNPEQVFTMDGFGIDPLGTELFFEWRLIEAPPGMSLTGVVLTGAHISTRIIDLATPVRGDVVAGEYKMSEKITNAEGESITVERLITLLPSSIFTASDVEVAQSPYLPHSDLSPLIRKKPIVARLKINRRGPEVPSNPLVPVKGIFTSGSQTYELVGCFRYNEPTLNSSITVHLVEKIDTINAFDLPSGNFLVRVNSPGLAQGIPAGVGCGDSVVNEVGQTQLAPEVAVGPLAYSSFVSPKLSLNFFKVVPACASKGEDCRDFRQLSDGQLVDIKDRTSKLVRAMFPVAPVEPFFKSALSVNVKSFDKSGSDYISYRDSLCSTDSFEGDELLECRWQASELYDLNSVRSSGRLIDPSDEARYVGIVPVHWDQNPPGYFTWLASNYPVPDPGYLFAAGVEQEAIPQTVISTHEDPMFAAHELGHSFHLRFPGGAPENGHNSSALRTSGFWIMRKPDLGGGTPLLAGEISNVLSFMVERPTSEQWPAISHWADRSSYVQIFDEMNTPSKARVAQFEGEQYFIGGAVNNRGQIAIGSMLQGVNVGQTVGQADHYFNLQLNNPAGGVVGQFTSPAIFSIDLVGVEGGAKSTVVAPISTGVPALPNVLSITASSDLSRTTFTFFPAVELFRTALGLIPDQAFVGAASEGREELREVLSRLENSLKVGDLHTAKSVISGVLTAAISRNISSTFTPSSPTEFGFDRFTDLVATVGGEISEILETYPQLNNGVIRVQPESLSVTPGAKSNFAIYPVTALTNPELEYFLLAHLDGNIQKTGPFDGTKWFYRSPALASGEHLFEFQIFTQPKHESKSLMDAIDSNELKRFELSRKLENETDPDLRAELETLIRKLDANLIAFRQRLEALRRPIGSTVSLEVKAN